MALATGVTKSAVAILRMSGCGTKDALKGVFAPFPKKPNYLQYGKLTIDGLTDSAMMVFFDAPKSYTGEEMAELHLHGSIPLIKKVMEVLFGLGFRLAQNGEFTSRAYLNGKTNLSKAEGLADLVNAESFASLRASSILAEGKLGKITTALQEKLTDALARLEATLDYPEEDLEQTELPHIEKIVKDVLMETENILSTAKHGKTAKHGVTIAIVGDTNVGKSSLLNAIVGFDRAIVSSVKGTTRDTLEESIDFNGLKLTFVDTAGQRETADEVEKIGVLRAKKAMQQADLLLLVIDDAQSDADMTAYEQDTPKIIVRNKADINKKTDGADIVVSAKTGQNVQELLKKIYDKVGGEQIMSAPLLLTGQRHEECLKQAQKNLREALELVKKGATVDLVASQIRQAWQYLGQVTGNTDMQIVVDAIFSKFCLGK